MYTNPDCLGLLANAENDQGGVNSFNIGAFSQSFSPNTVPLPENIIYHAYHGTHIYQSVPHLHDNGQFRWNPGLDDHWEKSSSMDWADALYHTFCEPEPGTHQC